MVKTSANSNAKGKATASSSALPAAKTTPRKVRPKVFKKKAKADPEKQKVVASEAATTAEVASAPSLKLAEVSPAATVANENGGQKMKMSKNEKMKVEEGERMKGTEKMSRNEKVEVGEKMKGNEKGRIKEKEKNGEKARERKSEAGFIFMCSGKTKPECFRNGVFGLPKGKIDAVEKIWPGAKLFLYDFDLKLLYGVYKAKTKGGLDLVRSAFHGKFPAQVKFKVDRDCLPLPESSFKHAIKENYNSKGKFTQELSPRQVHRLLELFKPVNLPQPSLQYVEERHRLDVSEGRIPQYVEETRVPRHVEEMHHSRAVEEMRLPYDYEERRWPRYVEDIEHPRFLEERDPLCSQYITHLPELQHAPPTYYRRVAPSDNWYHQPQVDIMYERSAPRAIVEATDREPLLARDYRVPEEIVARLDHVDELYRSYRLASRAMDLDHGPSYVTAAYENLRPAYSESIQRPVSTRANVPGVPVSSLYSFAGAPAYR